jgi:hypothetical protein
MVILIFEMRGGWCCTIVGDDGYGRRRKVRNLESTLRRQDQANVQVVVKEGKDDSQSRVVIGVDSRGRCR